MFWLKFQLQFIIEKPLPDLLTLSTTFYDVPVLCNRFLKARKAQIWADGNAGVNAMPDNFSLVPQSGGHALSDDIVHGVPDDVAVQVDPNRDGAPIMTRVSQALRQNVRL